MDANELETTIDKCVDAIFKGDFESAADAFADIESNEANSAYHDALSRRVVNTEDGKILDVVANDATPPVLAMYISSILTNYERYDAALACLKTLTDTIPTHPELYESIALCYRVQPLLDEALAAAREAVRLHPHSAYSHEILGAIYHDREEHEQAVTAYRKSTKLHPSESHVHWYLAMALRESQKLDEAKTSCRSAIALEPDPRYWYELAEIEYASGNKNAAIEAIKKIPKDCPSYEDGLELTRRNERHS